ncbi:TrbI/VirB10 family protein [Providencia sp. PROV117]|uniref:TrbI/VirB10 family protein n=1 Tax=Providencia sp. PROV117 TaxID=2949828 RepID=UPI00234A0572|nr:TrbI/VirB10 family protein [Providencia sp. PROV117]
MANINVRAKRKQTALFVLLALGLTGIGGAAWYMSLPSKPKAAAKQSRPAPNMTGVVTSSFDKNVGKSAMADLQSTASQMDKQMKQVNVRIAKLEQENRAYRDKITEQDKELAALGEELTKMGNDFIHGDSNNGLPQPQQLPVGTLPTPNAQASQPIIPPPTAFYQGGQYPVGQPQINVNPVLKQGLSSMTIEYEDEQENTDLPDLPYIPSGSFAKAMVIEGADANASVTGNSNPSPMQFRLTGKLIMPNNEEYDLSGCAVTAGVYGDISSERGLVRTDRLSCKLFGHTIDMPFKGHVSFMGKNGIKGEPVIRNGELVGYAFGGGFLEAVGSGFSKVGDKTVGIGASSTTTMTDVARGGVGGGVQQSGKMLSEYFIKRAEQYHPVIPIGAGIEITVVFQEGFQLKFIEQMKKAKSQKQAGNSLENSINQGITVSKQALERISLGDAVPAETIPQ